MRFVSEKGRILQGVSVSREKRVGVRARNRGRNRGTISIMIPVSEEWNHMFRPSESFPYVRRAFQRRAGRDDFVAYSEPYSRECGEPVWFYSWGNVRWLRCPIGRPGDHLNTAGDRISAVNVTAMRGKWMFVVSVSIRLTPQRRRLGKAREPGTS